MDTMRKKAKTRAELQREIMELKGQLAGMYHHAASGIDKAGEKYMAASGVLVRLEALGGREIINPTVIVDGLSADTIAALRRDIVRSFEFATRLKPKSAA